MSYPCYAMIVNYSDSFKSIIGITDDPLEIRQELHYVLITETEKNTFDSWAEKPKSKIYKSVLNRTPKYKPVYRMEMEEIK